MVSRKAPLKTESIAERRRKYVLARESALFSVGREDENAPRKKVTRKGKYEMIAVAADSGAADHVAPRNVASHLKIRETEASRQGVKYVAANGQKTANVGQRTSKGSPTKVCPSG